MSKFVLVLTCLLTAASPLSAFGQANKPQPASTSPADQGAKAKTPTVLICGTGPSPYFEDIVDQLVDSLVGDSKINAKNSDGHDNARSTCLEKTKEAEAGSLLYVVSIVSQENASATTLSVQCFSADGKKLWGEEQRGPFMSASVSSTVKGITAKMKKKIQAHVGQPGLPTS